MIWTCGFLDLFSMTGKTSDIHKDDAIESKKLVQIGFIRKSYQSCQIKGGLQTELNKKKSSQLFLLIIILNSFNTITFYLPRMNGNAAPLK